MTYQELMQQLEAFETGLAAYGVTKYTGKELWEQRAAIQEHFREVTFESPAQRQEAWQRFQDGTDMLKQKGALLQIENEAFALEVETRIEAQQRQIDDKTADEAWTREELNALRAGANDLFEFMRQNRWPTRERRNGVWDRFTAYRDRIKKLEDEHFNRARGDAQRRRSEWVTKQEDFLRMLREKLQRRNSDRGNLEKVVAAKQDFGPKLEQRLTNQQDYLAKLYDDLDLLETKLAGARGQDFRERMDGLIEAKKTRIAEVEKDMKGVQERIDTNKKDITEISGKIEKIAAGATELEAKIAEVTEKLAKGMDKEQPKKGGSGEKRAAKHAENATEPEPLMQDAGQDEGPALERSSEINAASAEGEATDTEDHPSE